MVLVWLVACKPVAPALPIELSTLTEGQELEGFRVEALYVDGNDVAVGTRLVHEHTGMELRLLQRDTVPQAYLWVHTVPDSDRGEPHTQEHLLLGKGNHGRAVATLEEMAMVSSSAFTEQHRTVYHFRTTAGPEVFFDVFQARLDALLNPDYLDLEIDREVHHWGVSEAQEGLVLEEKGTVYNEMDSSYQQPGWVLWSTMPKDLYGEGHPQTFESGGSPDALRELEPEHIRAFHAATYQLPNMGVIVFLPDSVPLVSALDRFDAMLVAEQPEPTPAGTDFVTEDDLPPPRPVADRSVRELRYPHGDVAGDATVTLAWPPGRELDLAHDTLLSLLLSGLAGAENTNLYKALIDSRTQERELGASSVWAWASGDQGHPLYMQVGGLSATDLSEEDVTWIAARLRRELADVASLPAGDPKLVDLHRRLQSELVSWRRAMLESMTGPPGFGTRGTGSGWYDFLVDLDAEGGFRRPLLMGPQLAWVEAQLAREDTNIWAEHLAAWGLLEAEPLIYVNRPSPERLAELSAAKDARVAAELETLRTALGAADDQAALVAFQAAYAEETATLEAAVKAPEARFIDDPPMTPDEGIDTTQRELLGVPLVSARFDAMSGAKVGLSLDLRGVSAEHAVWLRMLPSLLTEVGVIVDGEPVPHEEVLERLQREVLWATASTDTNTTSGRIELALSAAGTDAAETRAALGWAATFLTHPDWRPENLPRLHDLVSQSLDSTRQRMLGSEERWAANPAAAWQHQAQPLQLHVWSFLTYEHDLLRLKYRLTAPDEVAVATLRRLADTPAERADLLALLASWQGRDAKVPAALRKLELAEVPEALAAAANDLERTVGAIPDESLAADVAYLARRIAADLAEDPTAALAELEALRAGLLRRGGARAVVAGGALLDELDPDLEALFGVLEDGDAPTATSTGGAVLRARLADRGADADAVYVGLFDPNRRSGVAYVSAPQTTLGQTDEEHILDYLAVRTLGGGGAHSLFIQTWGAGLAYSNGSGASEFDGRMRWRAERCPKLPQTVDFVNDTVQAAAIDPAIAEYAVASAFWSNADEDYLSRASSVADSLVDGTSADRVRTFREAVLAQRTRPDLVEQLARRVVPAYGRMMPGLGVPTSEVEGAVSFVIGDRDQLDAWNTWLAQVEGGTVEVMYPRDFWLVSPPDGD